MRFPGNIFPPWWPVCGALRLRSGFPCVDLGGFLGRWKLGLLLMCPELSLCGRPVPVGGDADLWGAASFSLV